MLKKIIILLIIILPLLLGCIDSNKVLYEVDSTKCNSCNVCVEVCPQNAIEIIRGKAVIDTNSCTGCGKCAIACPQDAIR